MYYDVLRCITMYYDVMLDDQWKHQYVLESSRCIIMYYIQCGGVLDCINLNLIGTRPVATYNTNSSSVHAVLQYIPRIEQYALVVHGTLIRY